MRGGQGVEILPSSMSYVVVGSSTVLSKMVNMTGHNCVTREVDGDDE